MFGKLILNNNCHSKLILKHYILFDLKNYEIVKLNNLDKDLPRLEYNNKIYYHTHFPVGYLQYIMCMSLVDQYSRKGLENPSQQEQYTEQRLHSHKNGTLILIL